MKKQQFTENQKTCINALAVFAKGHHHLPKVHEFGDGVAINWRGDLPTYDGSDLTRLVLVAHAFAVRISVQSSGPGMVKIVAFKRMHGNKSELKFWEYHPDLSNLGEFAEYWKTVDKRDPRE